MPQRTHLGPSGRTLPSTEPRAFPRGLRGGQRDFFRSAAKAQKVAHLVVAECPDYRRGKTERDGLQHQAFGGMSRLHVNVAAPPISVLYGRALKSRCDANEC